VVLFGSLLGPAFCETSDIDLLVEGLPSQRFAEALGRLFSVAPVAVDLVPVETGRPEVVARALAEGEVLHGA
jgi:predicted nucleotidyltransferase